jgi:hypothetical protein
MVVWWNECGGRRQSNAGDWLRLQRGVYNEQRDWLPGRECGYHVYHTNNMKNERVISCKIELSIERGFRRKAWVCDYSESVA